MSQHSDFPLTPYKGARDFYPEDMRFLQFWKATASRVIAEFGYEPYDGPLLERVELYRAKTSEEIVSEQTYTFQDRGGRQVVIRPEMTPTLARMVAAKSSSLSYPLRWYTIPNLWRYERMQRGRLREHWQVNCDLIAPAITPAYELEMLVMMGQILAAFGATPKTCVLKINHRGLCDHVLTQHLKVSDTKIRSDLFYLLDRLSKIEPDVLKASAVERGISSQLFSETVELFASGGEPQIFFRSVSHLPEYEDFLRLWTLLTETPVQGFSIRFAPNVVRGFQYYTGLVFELHDTDPQNARALLGGGRYDNLIGNFSSVRLQGIGFGLGDVTFRHFLETHHLMPPTSAQENKAWVILASEETAGYVRKVQSVFLKHHIPTVVIYFPDRQLFKTGLKSALRKNPSYLVIVGQREHESQTVVIKDVTSRKEESVILESLPDFLKQRIGSEI